MKNNQTFHLVVEREKAQDRALYGGNGGDDPAAQKQADKRAKQEAWLDELPEDFDPMQFLDGPAGA